MEPQNQFRHKAWCINMTWETEKGGVFVDFRPVAGMCPATLEMLSFFWRAVYSRTKGDKGMPQLSAHAIWTGVSPECASNEQDFLP